MQAKISVILGLTLIVFLSTLVPVAKGTEFAIQQIARLDTNQALFDVQWSPDGRMIAVAGENGVALYDASLNMLSTWLETETTAALSWRGDSRELAVGGGIEQGVTGGKVWIIDVQTQEITAILETGYERAFAVSWSEDQSSLAVTAANSPPRFNELEAVVQIWDVAQQTMTSQSDPFTQPTRTIQWTSEDNQVVFGGQSFCITEINCPVSPIEQGVFFVDPTTGETASGIELGYAPSDIALTSNDDYLAVAFPIEFLVLKMPEATRYGITAITHPEIRRLNWMDDGKVIALAFREGSAALVDVNSGEISFFDVDYPLPSPITAMDWNPDHDLLVTVTHDGTIQIWNPQPA